MIPLSCFIPVIRENELILRALSEDKKPFLFSSSNLVQLLDLTPSTKTRLAMMSHIGPRLIDPKAQANQVLSLFRYAQDKAAVEEVLKARANVINSAAFKQSSTLLGPSGSTSGGRTIGAAGRGGGRGIMGRS